MEISSFTQVRDTVFSRIKGTQPADAIVPTYATASIQGNPHRDPANRHQQSPRSSVSLSIHSQPLHLLLKAVLVRISEEFAVQSKLVNQVSQLELTPESLVRHILTHIHQAFDSCRQQHRAAPANPSCGDFIDLVHDRVTEGVLEARMILNRLQIYDDALAALIKQIEMAVHLQIELQFKH